MLRPLAAALLLLTAAAACGRGKEANPPASQGLAARAGGAAPASAGPQASAPAAPAAGTASKGPSPEEMAAAAEIRKEIAAFQLTEPTLDKIIAIEGELKDFWADPVEARKIRGERSLPKILAAIDAAPRLKATIAKHGLTPREYILGSFSMIGGYIWEKAREKQPATVAGQQPPVSATTLATVQKRVADVTKVLSPPPGRTKPPRRNVGREDD